MDQREALPRVLYARQALYHRAVSKTFSGSFSFIFEMSGLGLSLGFSCLSFHRRWDGKCAPPDVASLLEVGTPS